MSLLLPYPSKQSKSMMRLRSKYLKVKKEHKRLKEENLLNNFEIMQ